MTVFSFSWQAMAEGVFLKRGILAWLQSPIPQAMNDKNKKWMTRQETAPATAPSCFQAAAHNHLFPCSKCGRGVLWPLAGGEAAQLGGWESTEWMLLSKPPAANVPWGPTPSRQKEENQARAQYSSAETKAQWELASLPVLKWFPDNSKLGKWSVLSGDTWAWLQSPIPQLSSQYVHVKYTGLGGIGFTHFH